MHADTLTETTSKARPNNKRQQELITRSFMHYSMHECFDRSVGGRRSTTDSPAASIHLCLLHQHQHQHPMNEDDDEDIDLLDAVSSESNSISISISEDDDELENSDILQNHETFNDDECDQHDKEFLTNTAPSPPDLKAVLPAATTLRIIAPEQKPTTAQRRHDTHDEWDDLEQDTAKSTDAKQIALAIQMSQIPLLQAATHWDLAPFLIQNLLQDKYASFFPIQSLVIPHILASERHEHIRSRDICVSSPTGSGKTLSFVLPILHSLHTRCIRRLRALCVLPSRDLALQVYQVFQRYSQGSDLKIGLAIGQSDFDAEQQQLILGTLPSGKEESPIQEEMNETTDTTPSSSSSSSFLDPEGCMIQYRLNPRNTHHAFLAFHAQRQLSFTQQTREDSTRPFNSIMSVVSKPSNNNNIKSFISKGGRSAVDVLVCTPGRLMDHLDKTPGFTLQHLRFLVMDEADRLLNQSYQNWLGRVLALCRSSPLKSFYESQPDFFSKNDSIRPMDPVSWRQDVIMEQQEGCHTGTSLSTIANLCHPIQLRKLLFSATMTQDPQKLSSLGLIHPQFFNLHGSDKKNTSNTSSQARSDDGRDRYSLPAGLTEYTLECTAQQKPLVLLALLLEEKTCPSRTTTTTQDICVVFTSSVESTHRLTRLLQLLWSTAEYGSSHAVAEFSSALNQKERSELLKRCTAATDDDTTTTNETRVEILVCSDGMSRGMDLSQVSTVINYDIPTFAKTYVHRCGRTARGGQEGKVINLIKQGQVTSFHKMRSWIEDKDRVKSLTVQKYLQKNVVPVYKDCVKRLGLLIAAEKRGEISPTDCVHLNSI